MKNVEAGSYENCYEHVVVLLFEVSANFDNL